MSERYGYQPWVPCWVDTWLHDPEAAVGFYTQLFGREAEDGMPPGSSGRYFVCKLRGHDVAAIGSQPPEHAGHVPVWATYVLTGSVEVTAEKVTEAGGSVAIEPFDRLEDGRMAVLVDPAGAVIGAWQAKEHRGAQLVNEPGAWAMSHLSTRDPEEAKEFYGALFSISKVIVGEP